MILVGLMQHMYESRMAAQATADLLSQPPMPEGTHDDGEGTVPGRVEVEGVTFSYEVGSPVLHGVSFTAEPGTVTALVGPSGGRQVDPGPPHRPLLRRRRRRRAP